MIRFPVLAFIGALLYISLSFIINSRFNKRLEKARYDGYQVGYIDGFHDGNRQMDQNGDEGATHE